MFENPENKVDIVLLPEATERANKVLNLHKIDMDGFSDLYSPDVIATDRKYLAEREQQIGDLFAEQAGEHRLEAEHTLELATIFHAIVVNNSSWFGPVMGTKVYATTRYDDVKHGVDAIVERVTTEGTSLLGLGIDVTFGKQVDRKIRKLKEHIDNGSLTKVKYFKSGLKSVIDEITQLPSVVVGATADTARELTNLFAKGKDNELGDHQVQFQVLEQILMQCEYFAKYARDQNKESLAIPYDNAIKFIRTAYALNKKLVAAGDKGVRDQFFDDMKRVLI